MRAWLRAMRNMRLEQDASFTFALNPTWQFWKRGVGLAEVIARDDEFGVVHLRIIGVGPCVIAHLPILERKALARALRSSSRPAGHASKDPVSRNAVAAWRFEHGRDIAGAFSVSLGEAIGAIYETATQATSDVFIETAYPIRDESGRFRTVRVVTAPTAG